MLNKWTNGYCSVFAIAWQRRFGGEIWAIINHSKVYPSLEDDVLIHAYCVVDGIAYDGNGATSLADACDISKVVIPDMDKDLDVVIQWRNVAAQELEVMHLDCNLDLIPEANAFIDFLTVDDMLDTVASFQQDYAMSDAEANAFADANKNYPKIRVKSLS